MLDVNASKELQATLLAIRRASGTFRKELYANTRREIGKLWIPALEARITSPLERRIIMKGAKASANARGFRVQAATSRKALREGLIPAEDWPGAEFGARSRRAEFIRRNRPITAMVNRQFAGRQKYGRIAFDAASEMGTKAVAVWVTTIVDTFRKAADGGR